MERNLAYLADLAWLAGLFEGEGCISLQWTTGSTAVRQRSRYPSVQLIIQSTDKDVLERVQSIAGGWLSFRDDPRPNHKRVWRWAVSRRAVVMELLDGMEPWLCERRCAKIKQAREHYALPKVACERKPGRPRKKSVA